MGNYNVPDKIDGNQWSADEHNQMKAAVNSKFDSIGVLTDPNAQTSNTTVFSSGVVNTLIQNIIQNGLLYKGQLSGGNNLNIGEFLSTGFWIGKGTFSSNPAHPSYPYNGTGILVVYANADFVYQEYTVFTDDTPKYTRVYISSTDTWTQWSLSASQSWVTNNFAFTNSPGTPTVTAGDGITINKYNSEDLKGRISIRNDSAGVIGAGANIVITFELPRQGLRTIVLTDEVGNSPSFKAVVYGAPNSTQAVIRIVNDLPATEGGTFYYLIQ